MKKFKVTQYLTNYSEVELVNASKEKQLVDLKQTINYQVVTVTAEDEIEAIAHVREQQLLPTIPDQFVQLVKRLWDADTIHHLYFATGNIDGVIPAVKNLPDFIQFTMDSVRDNVMDNIMEEIENSEMQ